MHAADLLSHPSPADLARVRSAVRDRLEEASRRQGPEAVDRAAIAAIFHDVIHPRGGSDARSRAR